MRNLLRLVIAAFLVGALATTYAENHRWVTSWKEAIRLSKKTHKPIFAYFTGTDWCIWCNRMDQRILDTSHFTKWSNKVVLLKLDFPQNHPWSRELFHQNTSLAQRYQITTFPTVLFLNSNGTVLARTGFAPVTPEQWTAHADSLLAHKG